MIKSSRKLSTDTIFLTKLASSIASDDLIKVDSSLKDLKTANIKPVKIYETILQSYLFCGFPAAIESFKLFKKNYNSFKIKNSEYNVEKFRIQGEINCKLVYKNNYKKLIENMHQLSPDLMEWMIVEGYGKVMSRKGLTMHEREFINVAILSTRFYKDQLHSHLKGCLNFNSDHESIRIILSGIKDIAGAENYNKAIKLLNH